jgi:hypothetical protein
MDRIKNNGFSWMNSKLETAKLETRGGNYKGIFATERIEAGEKLATFVFSIASNAFIP